LRASQRRKLSPEDWVLQWQTKGAIMNTAFFDRTSCAIPVGLSPAACTLPNETTPETRDGFSPIEEILDELRAGRMIVLVDDEHRENEGDLVIAAEKVTPESINFIVRNGCGMLGLALSAAICERLNLDPLPGKNAGPEATPWTPHIDARTGITTGTSACDRARTVLVAIDEATTPADIVVGKGHVPCLRARAGGALVRAGHTEGSVDLARLAGKTAPVRHRTSAPWPPIICYVSRRVSCEILGNPRR